MNQLEKTASAKNIKFIIEVFVSSISVFLSHSNSAVPASADESDQRENDKPSASPPSSSSTGRS